MAAVNLRGSELEGQVGSGRAVQQVKLGEEMGGFGETVVEGCRQFDTTNSQLVLRTMIITNVQRWVDRALCSVLKILDLTLQTRTT